MTNRPTGSREPLAEPVPVSAGVETEEMAEMGDGGPARTAMTAGSIKVHPRRRHVRNREARLADAITRFSGSFLFIQIHIV